MYTNIIHPELAGILYTLCKSDEKSSARFISTKTVTVLFPGVRLRPIVERWKTAEMLFVRLARVKIRRTPSFDERTPSFGDQA